MTSSDLSPGDPSESLSGSVGQTPVGPGERTGLDRAKVRSAIEWVVVIVGAVLVALLIRSFLFQVFSIPSESMVPTLQPGDRVVVNRLDDDPGNGDVVVFRRPETWSGQHDDIIKRVIATGGETVEAAEGALLVDGVPLEENYLAEGITTGDFGPVTVSEDELWVMGDNRPFSSDSRVNGPVPVDNVVGRAFLVIWPPGRIGGV